MVSVRSVRMLRSIAAGSEACSCGSSALMPSTTEITLAPGCRWMLRMIAGVFVHPGAELVVLGAVDDVARHR